MWKIINRFASLGNEFYQLTKPTPLVNEAKLIHLNNPLIQHYGLDDITENQWLQIVSGQQNIAGYDSLSSCYMGHQFGVPVARLGDGRAIMIAEHQSLTGVIELQLKGAGPTIFSRGGDGRAVLRSSIREYLISHAMDKLGIPTTKALAIVGSQDRVIREEAETAAVVLRTADSFIRFGHFEYYALHNKLAELEKLVRFVVSNYYPDENVKNLPEMTKHLLLQAVKNTATTIAKWQAVGFVHGVMNTDNMSILGLTIDYGPFAFMNEFNPNAIYNHSDSDGRYTYQNQPQIAWWNLYRLAEALCYLDGVSEVDLQPILDDYAKYYNIEYQKLMWSKLGITDLSKVKDVALVEDVLSFLAKYQIDYTFFWRKISLGQNDIEKLLKQYPEINFSDILKRVQVEQLNHCEDIEFISSVMRSVNPAFVLRSHLLSDAILKAQKDEFSEVDKLFTLCSSPFVEVFEDDYYYGVGPSWANNISLSCSS